SSSSSPTSPSSSVFPAPSPPTSSLPFLPITLSSSSLKFLAQEGPSLLIGAAGQNHSGILLFLFLRLSLLHLNTTHPLHPSALPNLQRFHLLVRALMLFLTHHSSSNGRDPRVPAHLLGEVSPLRWGESDTVTPQRIHLPSPSHRQEAENWWVVCILHVQNALQRLRNLLRATVAALPPSRAHSVSASTSRGRGRKQPGGIDREEKEKEEVQATEPTGCLFCNGNPGREGGRRTIVEAVEEAKVLRAVLTTLTVGREAWVEGLYVDREGYDAMTALLEVGSQAMGREGREEVANLPFFGGCFSCRTDPFLGVLLHSSSSPGPPSPSLPPSPSHWLQDSNLLTRYSPAQGAVRSRQPNGQPLPAMLRVLLDVRLGATADGGEVLGIPHG
ncbi:hypothetical protein Naga_101799g1, partial [Nannochloropsis gaditana]